MEINTEEYWRDGYTKLHKEYSFHMRENEHMKCQIDLLVHDKMVLENKVENLQKEIDFWKKSSVENHNAYLSAMSGYEDWHQKYIQEKMDHTTTSARIVFAKHILSGNRDENVIEHMRTYGV